MKKIEMQEITRCQDSRNTTVRLGTKSIESIGAMIHITSQNDLAWLFDMDYDHDAIEGMIMPVWMATAYSERYTEIQNNQKQITLDGTPNLNQRQRNFVDFKVKKAILYDPSSEVFYFSSKQKNKDGSETDNPKRRALMNFCKKTEAPKCAVELLSSDPVTYYPTFERIANDPRQRSSLISWSLLTQQAHHADVIFAMTPYISGKETNAFQLAVYMNQEAEILGDSIDVPIGHYYCMDFNFFSDPDVVDAAIEIFEEQYLKFDKSYQRIVAIKIVNDRFNQEPASMENLKDFLFAIRRIRDQTGVVFILMSGMETGFAALAKGFDFCSFPTSGYTNAGFSGSGGAVKAGLYDSVWLMKRKYPLVLRYYRQNGHLPVEGTFGMSVAFTDPESYARDEWNSMARKIMAEVKNNEAKKVRNGVRDGDVRIIKEKFLASKRKEYADLF